MQASLNPIEKHKSEIEKRISLLEEKFREVPLMPCRKMFPGTIAKSTGSILMMRTRGINPKYEGPRRSTSEGK
jgi:hypothetical protein